MYYWLNPMRHARYGLTRSLLIVTVVAAVITVVIGVSAFNIVTLDGLLGNSHVTVTGALLPPNKVDIVPTRVEFVNTSTEEKFSVPVENGHYSIKLPNHAFYRVTVTWTLIPGPRAGTSDAGTINLNTDTGTYIFDVRW